MPPPRSDGSRDNDPNWRGGNPDYEYIQYLIRKHKEKAPTITDGARQTGVTPDDEGVTQAPHSTSD